MVRKRNSIWKQTLAHLAKDRAAMIGMIGTAALILLSILAPYIIRSGAAEMDLAHINSLPSLEHLMGTDALGRDYLSRLLYGGRYSLGLGILASFSSFLIGVTVGSIAGYFGGWVDNGIMRVCDILQAIPPLMVSIIVSISFGTGYAVTILALALGGCTNGIRMTRAQFLSVRKSVYIDAARTINCGTGRIMFKHILPNISSPMLLDFTMKISRMIQIAAGLSVIGLGVKPPTPEWGAMLSAGRDNIRYYPHLVIFPGLFIIATSICINLLGDGLRDALAPKLKN